MAGGCQEVGIKFQDLPDVSVATPKERRESEADWAVMHSGNKVSLKNTLELGFRTVPVEGRGVGHCDFSSTIHWLLPPQKGEIAKSWGFDLSEADSTCLGQQPLVE